MKKRIENPKLLKDIYISEKAYTYIKWIAILTMSIDHLAVALWNVTLFDEVVYFAMRAIGRMAFPLFAFLLVECFFYTKKKGRHLFELLILAVISEIPFNLLITGEYFNKENQNVCLTLFWGFLMMILMNLPIKKFYQKLFKKEGFINFLVFATRVNIVAVFALYCRYALYADYLHKGIILIAMFYFAKQSKHRIAWTVWAFVIFSILMLPSFEFSAFAMVDLAVIFVALKVADNTIKCKAIGLPFLTTKPMQIIARWFYPFHLFLLWIIKISIQYFI